MSVVKEYSVESLKEDSRLYRRLRGGLYGPSSYLKKLESWEECQVSVMWVGSRVIGGYSSVSDFDLLLFNHVETPLRKAYLTGDLKPGGSDIDPKQGVLSYKTNDSMLNVLYTESQEVFTKWATATKVAKGLQLYDKPTRVAFFEEFTSIEPEVQDFDSE